MKSTAPASSAFSTSSPASLATLTMTIGSGLRAICSRHESHAVEIGHDQVAGHDVRLQLDHLLERLLAVARGAHDLEERTARQHLRDDLADVGRIVHDQDTGYRSVCHQLLQIQRFT